MRARAVILFALTATLSLAAGSNGTDQCDVDLKNWNDTSYPPVCTPKTWICYTTSGGE